MVFQFEHMGTTDGKYGKWTTRKPEMKKVRAVMNKWQAHGVDSLNVAAASAVAFWQLGKR